MDMGSINWNHPIDWYCIEQEAHLNYFVCIASFVVFVGALCVYRPMERITSSTFSTDRLVDENSTLHTHANTHDCHHFMNNISTHIL